ncbi:MAG: hypothetical protein CL678_07405 [Bdellovibrionaceae bacterium]|nr:hypothetical protein [Pseudobdellovibrionaceae bacterium]|tara:strand:- start:8816 stop:9535 length:720 start_codon:yes stop_codon:yes gene_type:complete
MKNLLLILLTFPLFSYAQKIRFSERMEYFPHMKCRFNDEFYFFSEDIQLTEKSFKTQAKEQQNRELVHLIYKTPGIDHLSCEHINENLEFKENTLYFSDPEQVKLCNEMKKNINSQNFLISFQNQRTSFFSVDANLVKLNQNKILNGRCVLVQSNLENLEQKTKFKLKNLMIQKVLHALNKTKETQLDHQKSIQELIFAKDPGYSFEEQAASSIEEIRFLIPRHLKRLGIIGSKIFEKE